MGGWLRPESAWAAQLLSSFQESIGVCGGIGEIGVHHGKLTIGLAHTLNGHHRGLALDLFDDQSKNVDNSGKGDKDIFLKNLARFGVAEQVLNIVQGSSMEVDPKTFGNGVAPCEDFKVLGATVDGGHTAAITLNDMALAAQHLVEGGIIMVDDWANDDWLGVREGVFQYILSPDRKLPVLAPFLINGGKIFLTTPNHHQTYVEMLLKSKFAQYLVYLPNRTEMNGYKVLVAKIWRGMDVLPGWKAFVETGEW